MELKKKALFNLLRINYEEDHTIPCEHWQIENLRDLDESELYFRLEKLGIEYDRESFREDATSFDSPEEFCENFHLQDQNVNDCVYLLLFELWRRVMVEKKCLSVFCDEIDHRISLYDRGFLQSDEMIQDLLAYIEEILDEHTDMGMEPDAAFQTLSEYCAHDIESFLFDYIYEQIETGNLSYASELLEGFYPFVQDVKWFNFLRACLLADQDIKEANEIISHLILELEKTPILELQMEILRFMTKVGDRDLFMLLVKRTKNLLRTEEDFLELMEIVSDFFRRLDYEEVESSIQDLMAARCNIQPQEELDKKDPDLKSFEKIIFL